VWVLVGGDGPQRQQAFRSGANVAAKLARCCDIQVSEERMTPEYFGEWLCILSEALCCWAGQLCHAISSIEVSSYIGARCHPP
jgi:hypothetical protein